MKMNMSTWIMLLLVFALAIFAYMKFPMIIGLLTRFIWARL